MRILAAYDFDEYLWPVHYSSSPFFSKQKVYFPYETDKALVCKIIHMDGHADEIQCAMPETGESCLPRHWKLFSYNSHVILSCGNPQPATQAFPHFKVSRIFLDLDDEMRRLKLPDEIETQYTCRAPLDETQDIVVGDYTMKYKNSRSFRFFDKYGKFIWEEKHIGYLYTQPEEKDGCVIFGTAGFGGGLYCYRLSEGSCLCAVNTKGTARYCWQKNEIVCRGREGGLLWADPFRGTVTNALTLPSILNDDSGIYADERYVCAVGFHKKTLYPSVYLIGEAI